MGAFFAPGNANAVVGASEAAHRLGEYSPMTTVVCISHVNPWLGAHGNEVRVRRLLEWLRGRGFRIVLVLAVRSITVEEHAVAESQVDRLVVLPRAPRGVRFSRWADRVRSAIARQRTGAGSPTEGAPQELRLISRTLCSADIGLTVADLVREERASAVLASYVFFADAFARLPPDVLRVVDTIEVFSASRNSEATRAARSFITLSAREERAALLRADVVLAIQSVECAYLRTLVPERLVQLVGIDSPIPDRHEPPSAAGDTLGIIASDNPYNVEGVRGFLREGWPRVRARVPGARLRVAGRVGAVVGPAPEGVDFLGWVSGVDQYYRSVRVALNPAVRGTGLKVKSIEALSHARPLVTFAVGIEGISVASESPWIVCSTWASMADAAVALLQSPAEADRLGFAASDFAHREFGADATYEPLAKLLNAGRAGLGQ